MDDRAGSDVCVFGVQRTDNAGVQHDITGVDGNQLGNLHRLQVSRAKAGWTLSATAPQCRARSATLDWRKDKNQGYRSMSAPRAYRGPCVIRTGSLLTQGVWSREVLLLFENDGIVTRFAALLGVMHGDAHHLAVTGQCDP